MATRPEVFVPAAAPLTQERRSALGLFWKRWGIYYLFMLPFLAVFTVFVIAPVLVAIFLSFTYFNVLEAPRWIGWSNYKLLFLEDDVFLKAIGNTLMFAMITGPVGFFISFFFAWLINPLKLKTPLALCFYAPSIVGAIAMSVVWKIVFAGDRYGYLTDPAHRFAVLRHVGGALLDHEHLVRDRALLEEHLPFRGLHLPNVMRDHGEVVVIQLAEEGKPTESLDVDRHVEIRLLGRNDPCPSFAWNAPFSTRTFPRWSTICGSPFTRRPS